MGCFSSLCPSKDEVNATGQFESLVVPKPPPVELANVIPENSDSDIPLFAPAPSDEDNVEISDVEIISDSDSTPEQTKNL